MSIPPRLLLFAALAFFGLAWVQRQLRGWRFVRVERAFWARFSRLSLPEKRLALSVAEGRPGALEEAELSSEVVDGRFSQLLEARWLTMRRQRRHDFVQLEADLLGVSTRRQP